MVITTSAACTSDNTVTYTYDALSAFFNLDPESKVKRNKKKDQAAITWRKVNKSIQKAECGLYSFLIVRISNKYKLIVEYRRNIIEEHSISGINKAKNYVDSFVKDYINVPQANTEYYLQKLIDVCEKLAENCKDDFWIRPLLEARNFLNIGNQRYFY